MTGGEVDAVLFDLDDTLCSFVQSSETLLAEAFEAVGVDPFFALSDYQARFSDYLDPDETIDELRSNCFADLAAERGVAPDLGRELATVYSARRDYTVEPVPGAASVLAALRETARLALVTNGRPALQKRKLTSLGFVPFFDVVVFGGYEAPPKPDPAPFRRALDRLHVDADRAVHVGNSPTTDIVGARAAGVSPVWIAGDTRAETEARPDYTVASLRDLDPPPWLDSP